jgi:hypothetical protein
MRWRIFLCVPVFAVTVCAATPAAACIWNFPVRIPRPTAEELEAERAQARRDTIQQRRAFGVAELARGADPAAMLAQMLVPNIRPVPIQRSDCGPENEVDFADGEETESGLLAGTYLAARDELQGRLVYFEGETPGRACNAEFRAGFAAMLRRRLDDRQLRAIYLFLRSRWNGPGTPLRRLAYFQDRARRPPLRWDRDPESIERWLRRVDEGRLMKWVLDDFWTGNGPLLGDSTRVCPAATARDPAIRAGIVAWVETTFPHVTRYRLGGRQP